LQRVKNDSNICTLAAA